MDPVSYPEDKRAMVEEALARFFPSPEPRAQTLYDAMHYSVFPGGKRFRSVLCLTACEVTGGKGDNALPTACAIELIHTYSLIHDDLPALDDDVLRRGKATCHVAYGEDIALLAGDALYAEAFQLVSALQESPPVVVVALLGELSRATGVRGMVGGQVVDLSSEGEQPDAATVNFIHEHKTGDLIAASAVCGALIAGADGEKVEVVREYGRRLGLAFQITDDILDLTGETAVLGKTAGSDRKLKKMTFPGVFGLDKAHELAEKAVQEAEQALGQLPFDTRPLRDLAWFVCQRES